MNATKSVRLNIWNEYESYNHWTERAKVWVNQPSTSEYWTQEESARYNLANELKTTFNENSPLAEYVLVYSDLLQHALGDVDWQEIADEFIEHTQECRELEAV